MNIVAKQVASGFWVFFLLWLVPQLMTSAGMGVSKRDTINCLQVFPPSDAKMFPEYILPLLSMLPDDSEESVRIAYAANIHKIAETANRFMMHSQEIHEIGSLDSPINRAKGSLSERKATSTKLGVTFYF